MVVDIYNIYIWAKISINQAQLIGHLHTAHSQSVSGKGITTCDSMFGDKIKTQKIDDQSSIVKSGS